MSAPALPGGVALKYGHAVYQWRAARMHAYELGTTEVLRLRVLRADAVRWFEKLRADEAREALAWFGELPAALTYEETG